MLLGNDGISGLGNDLVEEKVNEGSCEGKGRLEEVE